MWPTARYVLDPLTDMCVPEPRLTRRQSLSLAVSALIASRFRTPRLRTVEVGGGLAIHPRAEWGSDLPPKGPLPAEDDVKFLLVHHTAATTNYSQDSVVQQIRGIYSFHTGSQKGWNDVCYNFFVDRFGGVWEGRAGSLDGPVMADATGGSQGFAQLVCLLGNFEDNQPTPEMISSLEKVLAWLAVRYQIDPEPGSSATFVSRGSNKWPAGAEVTARAISGHRDMSKTACPGKNIYPLLETVIPTNVATLVAGWSGTAVTPSTPPSSNVESTTTSTSTTSTSTTTEAPATSVAETQAPSSSSSSSSQAPVSDSTSIAPTTSQPATSGDSESAIVETAKVVAITAAIVGTAAAGAAVVHRREQ